ncbi:hypothetical protein LUX09_34590 [Streptomyces albogriseolus]|nr:hypothetical protein [Streptomyces albogriseolus]
MTHDFGLHFTQELGNHFGSPTDSWPASAEQMTPFFAIVVNALGTDDAARWFEAARKAHRRVVTAEQDRTHHFGFAHHLDVETQAYQGTTVPVVAAFGDEGAAPDHPPGLRGGRQRVLRLRAEGVLA